MLAGMAGRDAGLLADKVVLLGQDKLVQDMKESLGSDGETSDYQRSTPSPREDTDQRIKEFITEGMDKECWKGGGWKEAGVEGGGTSPPWMEGDSPPSLSPDLGFVDYPHNFKSTNCKSTNFKSTNCDKKLPFVCLTSLKSSGEAPFFAPALRKPVTLSLPKQSTAKMLNKKVTVEIEKLPKVLSLVDKVDPTMFLMSKAPTTGRRTLSKNRKLDRTTKEISLSQKDIILNSFRIVKKPDGGSPPPPTHKNFTGFSPRTFYKSSTEATNKFPATTSSSSSDSGIISSSDITTEINKTDATALLTDNGLSVPSESAISSELPGLRVNNNNKSGSSSLVSSPGSSAAADTVRPFRFPTLAGQTSAIPCKWEGCTSGFKSHAKLSDHIKTVHMGPQLESGGREFVCQWLGCKVFGAKSSSASWLEKHVPLHGGKLTRPCIVEGCNHRFSSQLMLERHVNSHFSENSSGTSTSGPRKSIEGAPARKVLKRAGVKLKFRKLPFSARIFDFFDAGMMAGIRDQISSLATRSAGFNVVDDTVVFHSKAMSLRIGESGQREVQLRWIPLNILADEWVPLDAAAPTRRVKLEQLPPAGKQLLYHELLLNPRQTKKQNRKRKRTDGPSPFLTPEEAKQSAPPAQTKESAPPAHTNSRIKKIHPAANLFM